MVSLERFEGHVPCFDDLLTGGACTVEIRDLIVACFPLREGRLFR